MNSLNKIQAVLDIVNNRWKEKILDGTADKSEVLQDIQKVLTHINKDISLDTRPDQYAIEGKDGISRITIVTSVGVYTSKNPKQEPKKIKIPKNLDVGSMYPNLVADSLK